MRQSREVTRNDSEGRSNRVPVGFGNKLEFEGKDPAFEYRVVGDVPGRLTMFQQAGYEFCYSEQRVADKGAAEGGGADTRITVDLGGGKMGYLMRIRKEFFSEDQARKIEKVRAIEDQMRNKDPNPKRGVYPGLTDE
jgi:hypothetical protein